MSDYQLGQHVTISGIAVKVRDYSTWRPKDRHRIYQEAQENWEAIKAESGRAEYGTLRTRLIEDATKHTEGVIIGKRTMQQGLTESSYGEDNCFLPCESSQVWLVAFHLRRKPVMCFDHQVSAA